MTTSGTVLVAIGSGFAVVGLIAVGAGYEVRRVKRLIGGDDVDSEDEGVVGRIEEVREAIDGVCQRIEEEQQARAQEHRDVRRQLERNRRLTAQLGVNLVDAIDEELPDVELDEDDVVPDAPRRSDITDDLDDRWRDAGPGRSFDDDD